MLLTDSEYPRYRYFPEYRLMYRQLVPHGSWQYWVYANRWRDSAHEGCVLQAGRPCVWLSALCQLAHGEGHVEVQYLDGDQEKESVIC